jgi:hypothetical protein
LSPATPSGATPLSSSVIEPPLIAVALSVTARPVLGGEEPGVTAHEAMMLVPMRPVFESSDSTACGG